MRWLKGNSAKNWRTYVWERGSAKNSDYVCPQRTFNLVSGICVRAHPTHRHHWLLKCTKLRPCLVSTVHRMFAKDVWFITGFVSLIPSAGYLRWSTGWPVKRPSPFNMCSILDRGCFFTMSAAMLAASIQGRRENEEGDVATRVGKRNWSCDVILGIHTCALCWYHTWQPWMIVIGKGPFAK